MKNRLAGGETLKLETQEAVALFKPEQSRFTGVVFSKWTDSRGVLRPKEMFSLWIDCEGWRRRSKDEF